ncbi:MAG: hypothetical protein ACTSQZ_01560 [Candidatus Thorarchaeota archaeon]
MRTKSATGKLSCPLILAWIIVLVILQILEIDSSFIFLLGFIMVICIVSATCSERIISKTAIRPTYRPLDPTFIQRVIIGELIGQEVIVSGPPEMTYRDACLDDWQFKLIQRGSEWIIVDERKNDITNTPLASYHGIAKIVQIGVSAIHRTSAYAKEEEEQEKPTSDYGVEYYD